MKKQVWFALVAVALTAAFLAGCSSSTEEKISYYAPGDYMVVNIADSYRLLKVSPVLVLSVDVDKDKIGDQTYSDYLTAFQPLIRDRIISHIRTFDEATLKSTGVMDQLRTEITQLLQNDLEMSYVKDVYFNDFVIQ